MSDVIAYIMIVGMVVLPGYAAVQVCAAIIAAVYQNMTIVTAFPFP